MRGWDRRNAHYFQLIQSLARHYGFDIETPGRSCRSRCRKVLLTAAATKRSSSATARARRAPRKRQPFEGILPNLERRYRETESPTVREELAKYLGIRTCPDCGGTRLNRAARYVFVADAALPAVTRICRVGHALEFFRSLHSRRLARRSRGADRQGSGERLRFLNDVGLDYLTLDRSADTLSGGEAQRIRLASQVGSGLTGVMYILDEPSIGLHQRDNARLLGTLKRLRDIGNTVIVVEHDEEAIREADHVVDLGPGAGVHGGRIVAQGTPREIKANPRLAHRPVPERQAHDRPAAAAHAALARQADADRRRHRQQPAQCRLRRSRSACSPA